MGFFDRGRPNLKRGSFSLTQGGQAKLQSAFDGSPRARILVSLETAGSSLDFDDLAQATGLSKPHLEHLLPSLLRKGFVQDNEQMGGAGL